MRARSWMLPGLLVGACLIVPQGVEARSVTSLKFDLGNHRVGGLRIGASSSQVKRRFGSPKSKGTSDNGGSFWIYSCGNNCQLLVLIVGGKMRLASASSESTHKRIRTSAGTYLGLTTSAAERKEGARTRPGCVTELSRVRGRYTLEVAVNAGDVNAISLRDSKYSLSC